MKLVSPLPSKRIVATGYDAIFATYLFRPVPGARVKHRDTGEVGTILMEHPSSPDRVHVQFDNCAGASLCHPVDLEFDDPAFGPKHPFYEDADCYSASAPDTKGNNHE